MTESGTDFFISWLSISIFRDIILTFPVGAINFAGTHIVLPSVTVKNTSAGTVCECVFVC
jgi:hypothetical protein